MVVRDLTMYVEVMGQGSPVALMHGGPGADHTTLLPLQPLADDHTLIFYDHRCNGRTTGADVSTMSFDNLTADADALREALGFERWAVLGHSFGGMVALEYALRYPERLTHLILLDTCGDIRWAQEYAPELLARRGFSPAAVEAARRFFHGDLAPNEVLPAMMRFGRAYYYPRPLPRMLPNLLAGRHVKMRRDTLIYAFSQMLPGWSVMDRLNEIQTPALVLAGRDDFQFPPEHQAILADRLPNARLEIIERAGHNAPIERPAEVVAAIARFLSAVSAGNLSRDARTATRTTQHKTI